VYISEVRTFCRSGIQVSGTSELAQKTKKEVSLHLARCLEEYTLPHWTTWNENECHKWKISRGSWSNCGTEGVPHLLAGILETSSLRAAGLAKLANQSETGLGRRERNTLVIDDEWASYTITCCIYVVWAICVLSSIYSFLLHYTKWCSVFASLFGGGYKMLYRSYGVRRQRTSRYRSIDVRWLFRNASSGPWRET
jgi:hypothetical protein